MTAMRPPVLNPLFADITSLPGIGPKLAALISKVAGPRVVDLIMTAPVSLVDRSYRPRVADARDGEIATLDITIERHEAPPKNARRLPYRVICSDDTGFITLIFFHARADYLKRTLPEGARRFVSGKIEDYRGAKQMAHPDHIVDIDASESLPLFEPVYPLTAGLTSNTMRKAVHTALDRASELIEWQDKAFLKNNKWEGWLESLTRLHHPQNRKDLSFNAIARTRLAYDELLANQTALALIRQSRKRATGIALNCNGRLRQAVMNRLPFELTPGQKAAIDDIDSDMGSPERMIRLVQGDVGSGKTIVALLAILTAVEAGKQAALMAPTEILARQHIDSIAPLIEGLGINIVLLTGRDGVAARRQTLEEIQRGDAKIIVGTHAVFQQSVEFSDLGLVVIDEQHRFGVRQRIQLTQKGARPDLLVMTATPIPRTLALTAYGDMEVSKITDKPPGRKPIDTRALPISRIDDVAAGIRRAIDLNEQAYWICPLVEESELLDLTAVEDRFETLKALFGDKVGIVHGRMSGADKDAVMERFYRGDIAVLVATTVIEVGVNAPNATIMIIEHAERFGLAQLHQLRGRVGRGAKAATCLLLYKAPLGETASARLKIMRESNDGFMLAEEDLRLRGAGDPLGAAQSGFPDFRLADAAAHGELLKAANDDARLIIANDPTLKSARGEAIRTLLYLFARDDAIKLLSAG